DEILSGRTRDSNLHHLAGELTRRGLRLIEARVVGDDHAAIVGAVNDLRARVDHLFTSGGIGPTHDDITADAVAAAFGLIADPDVLLVILGSAVFGILVGAIPGLTATMATALLVPVTFFMPPVPALAAIVTTTAMAIFAGDIPSTLLRMPGTPASAAYTDEAFAMTKRGEAELALGVNVV
ncbi:MAG: tripartite tricarboxylate transporter permease, partial [Elioraea sp.]|nr:tripartite tricarboxylate transporter permease [Elioraea sp.]